MQSSDSEYTSSSNKLLTWRGKMWIGGPSSQGPPLQAGHRHDQHPTQATPSVLVISQDHVGYDFEESREPKTLGEQ